MKLGHTKNHESILTTDGIIFEIKQMQHNLSVFNLKKDRKEEKNWKKK